MGYIYKIINSVNEKIYVGQTKRTLERRWYEHQKYALENDSQSKFYKAMRKIGIDKFQIISLEQVYGVEERNQREQYWIEYYDSFKNGYNSTRGGGCYDINGLSKKELFDLIVEKRIDGKSYDELIKIFHCGKSTISAALKSANLLGKDSRRIAKEEQIIEMLSQGEYLINISKELQCDFKMVQKIFLEHPEFSDIYQNVYTPLDKNIFLLKDTTTLTNAEIAKRLNCSERTIYRALNRRKEYNT